VSGEIKEMNKKASALKIQESYKTSKGITMRRYIDKEQSPQCQIEMEEAIEHFIKNMGKTGARLYRSEPRLKISPGSKNHRKRRR
jgi:hypothetical protein